MEDNESEIRWRQTDISKVDSFIRKDGENHLPITKEISETPTWIFYESYIHILEGDTEFDFSDIEGEELKKIDWQELKIVTQKIKGEEPEEYDDSVSTTSDQNLDNMRYIRNFLLYNFGKDFGLLNPDKLEEIDKKP